MDFGFVKAFPRGHRRLGLVFFDRAWIVLSNPYSYEWIYVQPGLLDEEAGRRLDGRDEVNRSANRGNRPGYEIVISATDTNTRIFLGLPFG
ncbi:hypothetical protein IVB34_15215 [Bradyrhizobium sp. 2]|uniref:hypothetical protein n=1 Tax=Bradyrhizobium sp. 2 TaxID=190045 RepID=UPI001FF8C30E|nr:hypothetical protein [Bradyrhizobium sp. 2]MCK1459695.1 hypothetical protein [Bradyrhizobium sp. 2]